MLKQVKFISLVGIFLWVIQSGWSQKEPQYTQYMYNIGSFNPAYVGSVETPDIAALYRAQWLDIPGAPTTFRLGANVPLGNERMGIGFNAISEGIGPITQTYIDGSYSFQVPLNDNTNLSFGLNAGGSFLAVDYSEGTFQDPRDPFFGLQEQNNFYPIIGAGVFMYAEEWYVGLSVPNFLTNGIYNDEVAAIVEDETQLNFIAGYVFDLSDSLKFKPAFLLNYLNGIPLNANLSANLLVNESLTLGVGYRFDNALSGLAGFQISPSMFIGYSYDYTTNALADFNSGSHEAILKFYLGRGSGNGGKGKRYGKERNNKGKPKQIDSPRFF